jgi:hypothetical protein
VYQPFLVRQVVPGYDGDVFIHDRPMISETGPKGTGSPIYSRPTVLLSTVQESRVEFL